MAIPDPTKSLDIVSTRDENLDLDAMDVGAYYETRDPALIRLKNPAAPAALFTLATIPYEWLCRIDDANNSPTARYRDALLASCRQVVLSDGTVLKAELQNIRVGSSSYQVAKPSWLKILADQFGNAIMREIGLAAYERANLPKAPSAPLSSG